MPYDTDTDTDAADRSRFGLNPGDFDRTDRILLGSCAGIWLAALGAGVAATVALVDLGGGHTESSGDSGTPWLLYTVIAISAAVIIGAVPLLMRARRDAMAEAEPPARSGPVPGMNSEQMEIRHLFVFFRRRHSLHSRTGGQGHAGNTIDAAATPGFRRGSFKDGVVSVNALAARTL